jgi:hypothetical protein
MALKRKNECECCKLELRNFPVPVQLESWPAVSGKLLSQALTLRLMMATSTGPEFSIIPDSPLEEFANGS